MSCDQPVKSPQQYKCEMYKDKRDGEIAPFYITLLHHLQRSKPCPDAKNVLSQKRKEMFELIEQLRVRKCLSPFQPDCISQGSESVLPHNERNDTSVNKKK